MADSPHSFDIHGTEVVLPNHATYLTETKTYIRRTWRGCLVGSSFLKPLQIYCSLLIWYHAMFLLFLLLLARASQCPVLALLAGKLAADKLPQDKAPYGLSKAEIL